MEGLNERGAFRRSSSVACSCPRAMMPLGSAPSPTASIEKFLDLQNQDLLRRAVDRFRLTAQCPNGRGERPIPPRRPLGHLAISSNRPRAGVPLQSRLLVIQPTGAITQRRSRCPQRREPATPEAHRRKSRESFQALREKSRYVLGLAGVI